MTAIPYRGAAPAINDLLGGSIDMIFDFASTMTPMIETGKLRPLAITGARRLASLPDIPTFAETGYPEMKLLVGAVVIAPAGVPKVIIERLSQALGKVVEEPSVVEYLEQAGSTPLKDMDNNQLASWLAEKRLKEQQIIVRAGIQAD